MALSSNACDRTVEASTTHDTPQHNGVAERLNRTLVERVRTVLHASGLPKTLNGERACGFTMTLAQSSTLERERAA